ncbi:MAG TPA: acyltransferase [Flavobacteriales bacterium]|nr:acyltransferase [Flavobacteriales bacterium]
MHGSRVYGLDILRAFAVLFVVYIHGYYTVQGIVPKYSYMLPAVDGVNIFFVLSGFLIGGILIKLINSKENFTFPDLFNFWIRRWFRTLPNYFFILCILLLIFYFKHNDFPEKAARYFVFLQNFNWPQPTFYSESWSLSVEEWFYLVIPLGFYGIIKIKNVEKRKLILFWIIAVLVVFTAYRCFKTYYYGFTDINSWALNIRRCVVTRLDSIMMGVLCAYIYFYHEKFWYRNKNLRCTVGIFLLIYPKIHAYFFPGDAVFLYYFYLTVVSLGTALILPKLTSIRTGSGIMFKIFTFVSLVSYSAYLVNLSLVQENIMPLLQSKIAFMSIKSAYVILFNYAVYWFITFGLAYLIYRFFEKPVMKLRDKF